MKRVKCKSGLMGSQLKLQKNYDSFSEFKQYCSMYGIHTRLGYRTMKSAWESNPTIQVSTNPEDLSLVYFHVIRTKNSLRIKESTERLCSKIKGSIAAFLTREGAVSQLNSTVLNNTRSKI